MIFSFYFHTSFLRKKGINCFLPYSSLFEFFSSSSKYLNTTNESIFVRLWPKGNLCSVHWPSIHRWIYLNVLDGCYYQMRYRFVKWVWNMFKCYYMNNKCMWDIELQEWYQSINLVLWGWLLHSFLLNIPNKSRLTLIEISQTKCDQENSPTL